MPLRFLPFQKLSENCPLYLFLLQQIERQLLYSKALRRPPSRLFKIYGMTSSEALRLYGVLTGMALPCILFPSALTTSIGTVLMPAVSAAPGI